MGRQLECMSLSRRIRRDMAQLEFQRQSQAGLVAVCLADLRHHRQVDGGHEESVCVIHTGLLAKE